MSNKIYRFFFVFLLFVMLVGCNNTTINTPENYNIVLKNEDSSVYLDTEVSALSSYALPILEKEDEIFLGWSDGDDLYYGDLEIVVNFELTATFEVANEVFTYDREGDDGLRLTGYTGNAKILKIPEVIDGYYTRIIGISALRDTDIEGVYIPNTVKTINPNAFMNADELEFVRFYGDYKGTDERIIGSAEFDEIISEHSDVCSVTSGSLESGIFTLSEGCPVIESFEITGVIEVGGVTYFSYSVLVDLAIDFNLQWISPNAFYSADSLTEVNLPDRMDYISAEAFAECYNIEEINTSDDSIYYKSVDGVLYSKDMTTLVIYPSGLRTKEFVIPSTVNYSYNLAFSYNAYIETIVIGENLDGFGFTYNLPSLTNYIVDSNNEDLFSDEGVLYLKETSNQFALISYPASKIDTSYTLVEGTTSLATYSFSFNKFLETLDLGSNISNIGSRAFYSCLSLKVLEIPDSVSQIGMDFALRSSIETVILTYTGTDNIPFLSGGNLDPRTAEERLENVDLPEQLLPDIYLPDETYGNYFYDAPNNYWLQGYVYECLHKISELESE